MSANSPNHPRPELSSSVQNVVTPQPVTDPTILDSVAGFINEVVPTTGGDYFDSKDQIQWVRFEHLDFDEPNLSPTSETALPSSLILILGYTTGVQVWAVPANGEAIELFSWRHGSVKVLRILPAPYEVGVLTKRDHFDSKRPLVALVDVATHGSSSGSLNFYSLKTGEQVKQIKFKSQILDVLANRRSVVITFPEKIAVFDAFTLEDKLSVTSCYLSPGIQPNPVSLGSRWLAFAEKRLVASRRSSGGNEGEGVQSYTATVLHAAKSLGRGLRELGDVVASSLTGNQGSKLGTSPNSPQAGGSSDVPQKGIVSILDIESTITQNADGSLHPESVVAHFVAHSEAIVWLQFGPCGMLLLTADKRGHDFNLFRINPHPIGSALAAVHHLYTLHRGDTSARVQDMCFSFDCRWVAVSTLRGTTHVFPITPYGGNIGVRTHTTSHVVNKMSRFHRSAGLASEGRSNSPVLMFEAPVSSTYPYHNPRFAPFPHPTVINPLAQLRQPVYMQNIGNSTPRQGRQRLTSSSEDNIALRVTACFAPARAWIDSTTPSPRETTLNKAVKPVESLFVMNCHGTLVQYDLEPHHINSIPKERVCDDSPIELAVTAKAQWGLQRQPTSIDRPLPLPHQSLMFVTSAVLTVKKKIENGNDDDWLSQVEIITHAGPHRRLWMGPQFTFKTYTTTNGTPMSLADAQPLDLNRSKPVNMPITKANAILIESSSASSSEQSLLDIYRKNCEEMGAAGEHQIKEDLADAMIESSGVRDAGGRCVLVSVKTSPTPQHRVMTAPSPIAKVVNPLGTVVTVHSDDEAEPVIPEDIVIYENCDETLFRPLVTPKTLAYCRSSKADGGNIMTQSLRGDTNVTVRVLEKNESPSGASWEDPSVRDIRSSPKVIVKEGEVKDLMMQISEKPKDFVEKAKTGNREKPSVKQAKTVNQEKQSVKQAKTDNQEKQSVKLAKTDSQEKQSMKQAKSNKAVKANLHKPDTDDSVANIAKTTEADQNSLQKTFSVSDRNEVNVDCESRISSEREVSEKCNNNTKPLSVDDDVFDAPNFEESSYGLVNPLYNVLEECERIKSKNSKSESIISSPTPEEPAGFTASRVSRRPKNKQQGTSECLPKEIPYVEMVPDYNKEIESKKDNEPSFTISSRKTKRKVRNETRPDAEDFTSKTSSSLLQGLKSVEEISFSALDSKLANPEFPPLEENFFSLENLAKAEKYEDAEDCGLPLQPVDIFDRKNSSELENPPQIGSINELVSSGTMSTSEDNIVGGPADDKPMKKIPVRKPRRPKPRLGVKIGSLGKEESPDRSTPEQSFADVSAEITLPVPRRSWCSVVASKPAECTKNDPWSNSNNNNNTEVPIPKEPIVESYTITLPSKKSYSTTEKLLDIDTPEERSDISATVASDLLEIDQDKSTELKVDSPDLLKLSDKSSDDEKNESRGSPVETTGSSDEGKILGIMMNEVVKESSVGAQVFSKTNTKRRMRKWKK